MRPVGKSKTPSLRDTVFSTRRVLAAGGLLCAVVVNLVQFPAIEDGRTDRFGALHQVETKDVMVLASGDANFQARYGHAFALGEVAPGSLIMYDADEPLAWRTIQKFAAFGKAREVRLVNVDQDRLLRDFDPMPHVVASGPGGHRGQPWLIAIDGPHSGVGARQDPEDLLAATFNVGVRSPSAHRAREFVFLQWDVARPGSDYETQALLIETSLLPADLLEEPAS